MNLIGKILVGVIFVMSIVFMTLGIVLYQTQSGWKDKTKKVEDERSKIQTRNTQLETEIKNLTDEYERLVAELKDDKDKLTSKNQELSEENKTLSSESVILHQDIDSKTKLLASTQTNMSMMRDELLDTRDKLATARTELHEQFVAMVDKTNTARVLALELATLKSTFDVLKNDHVAASSLLANLGYRDLAPDVYLLDVPPRITGTITDIRPNGLLEINIGRDDGLLQGHKLHVYRDKNQGAQSYLGRIEIIDVKPGKSVGKIMPEYRAGTILRNDNVTAYLSQITASL
jgi:cell shape-determining protein MreC